jgi:intracellular septation protein
MRNLAAALQPLGEDLLSTIFFAILLALTGDVFLATGIGIAIGIGQVVLYKLLGRQIAAMQWMSLALVVVFGSLTLYFHDPRFVIVKFTIAKLAIGAVMLKPNWMDRYLPKIVTDTLSKGELALYSALWPVMMFGLAAANLYIGLELGRLAWEWFLGVVAPAAPWVLFGIQYPIIRWRVVRTLRKSGAFAAAA